jgi:hypothetical protein
MFQRHCYACVVTLLMVEMLSSRVQAADPAKSNYLVFRSKKPDELTELQRLIEPQGKDAPDYRVIINASAAVREDKSLDLSAIDWQGLRDEIRESIRIRVNGKKFAITFSAEYFGNVSDDETMRLLRWTLKGMSLDCGFDKIYVSEIESKDKEGWAKDIKMKKAYDLIGKNQEKEPASGDDFVAVYPVRTPYSRHVLSGADCVVEIKRPYKKGDDGSLTEQQESAIVDAINNLKLPSKELVYFRAKFETDSKTRVGKTFENLTRKLGFKSHITHSAPAD